MYTACNISLSHSVYVSLSVFLSLYLFPISLFLSLHLSLSIAVCVSVFSKTAEKRSRFPLRPYLVFDIQYGQEQQEDQGFVAQQSHGSSSNCKH